MEEKEAVYKSFPKKCEMNVNKYLKGLRPVGFKWKEAKMNGKSRRGCRDILHHLSRKAA